MKTLTWCECVCGNYGEYQDVVWIKLPFGVFMSMHYSCADLTLPPSPSLHLCIHLRICVPIFIPLPFRCSDCFLLCFKGQGFHHKRLFPDRCCCHNNTVSALCVIIQFHVCMSLYASRVWRTKYICFMHRFIRLRILTHILTPPTAYKHAITYARTYIHTIIQCHLYIFNVAVRMDASVAPSNPTYLERGRIRGSEVICM